ncbi:MAG: DUF5615 family PIN-like protein [Acidobacteriota bacterium]
MKFLLDAQLPPRLAIRLRSFGHECSHTRELPLGNRTPDSTISEPATNPSVNLRGFERFRGW